MQAGRVRIGILLIGLLVVAAVAVAVYWQADQGPSTATLDPDDGDKVALGRQIYGKECASCHGVKLEGQPHWRIRRPNGRLPAPPHDESGHTWHHPDEMLVELTKYGPAAVVQTDYETDMPAYDGVLSDEQIAAVLSFIKSTWPEDVRVRHDDINVRSK